jgi:hypothetical protein
MITRIQTPEDAIQMINENIDGLLTGKRKIPIVKEVNNAVGKMLEIHKLEAISKALGRNHTELSWFKPETINDVKQIKSF